MTELIKEFTHKIQNEKKDEVIKEIVAKIKSLKPLTQLDSCIDDARMMQDFFVRVLGVLPENSIVMAEQKDA